MTDHVRLALVAPDSFKGTFTAPTVAEALSLGVADAGMNVDLCPVADGGEGTLDVLMKAHGGRYLAVEASGPLGEPVIARFGLLANGEIAIVETAEASGLALVPAGRRDPERASTAGTGQLIAAAVHAGASTVLIAVGGSATTDGGVGAIREVQGAGGLGKSRLVVLCDVRTEYEKAAEIFGPQKGADAATVARLTARLHQTAAELPRDPRGREWTGCAGGLSGGLWAAFDAELVAGAAAVLEAVGFDRRLAASDLVIAGEGRIDSQSFTGKIIGEIARRANRAQVPLHVAVGRNGLDFPSRELASVREASTLAELRAAGAEIARGHAEGVLD